MFSRGGETVTCLRETSAHAKTCADADLRAKTCHITPHKVEHIPIPFTNSEKRYRQSGDKSRDKSRRNRKLNSVLSMNDDPPKLNSSTKIHYWLLSLIRLCL
jgi:hypothetical protein